MEKKLAKKVKGTVQPASGSTPWKKEDVKDTHFLYQHKHTEGESIRVTKGDLETLRKNAVDEGRAPCFVVEFGTRSFFMVDENLFNILKAEYIISVES